MINIKFGTIEDCNTKPDTYVGIMPAGITTKHDLLKSYADVFKFPDYFGFNWDALEECLGDFHWIKDQKHIVIYHADLPQIDEKDIKILLDVLNRNAGEGSNGSLSVYFPMQYQEKIELLLKS